MEIPKDIKKDALIRYPNRGGFDMDGEVILYPNNESFRVHYISERMTERASQNASTSESKLPVGSVSVSAIDKMADTELKEQERLLNGEIAELEGRLASVENEIFYRKNPECRYH